MLCVRCGCSPAASLQQAHLEGRAGDARGGHQPAAAGITQANPSKGSTSHPRQRFDKPTRAKVQHTWRGWLAIPEACSSWSATSPKPRLLTACSGRWGRAGREAVKTSVHGAVTAMSAWGEAAAEPLQQIRQHRQCARLACKAGIRCCMQTTPHSTAGCMLTHTRRGPAVSASTGPAGLGRGWPRMKRKDTLAHLLQQADVLGSVHHAVPAQPALRLL